MSDTSAAAFERLHPSLRYVIATHLGWHDLRPIQRAAIDPILDGAASVIVAPTAGGKTEAVMFPLFSKMLDERWDGTSVLYLAPLRALLNDLAGRLGEIAERLGLSVAVWHGDTSQHERRRIVADPPNVLLTTPESLEVLLSMVSEERRAILSSARAIVVDEAHAFYGIDRGTHLLALIERLQQWAQHDVQRVALSATIGNPADLLEWFAGSSRRERRLIESPLGSDRRESFELFYRPGREGVVAEIGRFAAEKTIVFCRTRSDVEEIAHRLWHTTAGAAWPHHSALSRANREDGERAFREARFGALVATSTLELGIDIGDLDRVVQVDAPTTVASLKQRLGRTGRRGGDARMTFLPTNQEQFVLSAALLMLHAEGYVEPLTPAGLPLPIVAQQMLAMVLQTGGIDRHSLVERCRSNAAFAQVPGDAIEALLAHLLEEDVFVEIDGAVVFGLTGERRYGYRRFMELASVFRTGESVEVRHGASEIGSLDQWFVDEMFERERSSFILSGRAWTVASWPDNDGVLQVKPAEHAEAPLFLGGGLVLGFQLMQAVRRLLASEATLGELLPKGVRVDESSETVLGKLRETAASQKLHEPYTALVANGGAYRWHTYAGIRANRWIADVVVASLGFAATCTNTAISFRAESFDGQAFRKAVDDALRLSDEVRATVPKRSLRSTDAKFSECLSPQLFYSWFSGRHYEADVARHVLLSGFRLRAEAMANLTQTAKSTEDATITASGSSQH